MVLLYNISVSCPVGLGVHGEDAAWLTMCRPWLNWNFKLFSRSEETKHSNNLYSGNQSISKKNLGNILLQAREIRQASYLNPSQRSKWLLAWPQSNNISFYQEAHGQVDKMPIPVGPVKGPRWGIRHVKVRVHGIWPFHLFAKCIWKHKVRKNEVAAILDLHPAVGYRSPSAKLSPFPWSFIISLFLRDGFSLLSPPSISNWTVI